MSATSSPLTNKQATTFDDILADWNFLIHRHWDNSDQSTDKYYCWSPMGHQLEEIASGHWYTFTDYANDDSGEMRNAWDDVASIAEILGTINDSLAGLKRIGHVINSKTTQFKEGIYTIVENSMQEIVRERSKGLSLIILETVSKAAAKHEDTYWAEMKDGPYVLTNIKWFPTLLRSLVMEISDYWRAEDISDEECDDDKDEETAEDRNPKKRERSREEGEKKEGEEEELPKPVEKKAKLAEESSVPAEK